jgi:LysR family transcriptional activator of nhaA
MEMIRLMARELIGMARLPPIVVRDELNAGLLRELFRFPALRKAFLRLRLSVNFRTVSSTN